MAEVKRAARVAARMRHELADLLGKEVRDPRVVDVLVTNVSMTDDLQLAKVYVRASRDDSPATRATALKGLAAASGMLRRSIGERLGLRYAPKLVFYFDEGVERRDRIEQLLNEVSREPKAAEVDETTEPGDSDKSE